MEMSIVLDDPYTLDSLMIDPDGHPMRPDQRTYRIYRCESCGTQVDAELAEATVWERVKRLRPTLIDPAAPALARHAELRKVLTAISYRPWSVTFSLHWNKGATTARLRAAGT